MRKLKIIEHISLDGVIQAPGAPNEDGSNYPYGGLDGAVSRSRRGTGDRCGA